MSTHDPDPSVHRVPRGKECVYPNVLLYNMPVVKTLYLQEEKSLQFKLQIY
jgi:hypothetical protein